MSPASDTPQMTLAILGAARDDIPAGLWTVLAHDEQLYVAALLADPTMNQGNAAVASGRTRRRAKQAGHEIASRLHVKAAVDAAIAARIARVEVKQDRVLREVDTVSLSTIEHYRLADDGNLVLADGAPPDAMRAISSVKYRTLTLKDGSIERTVEFKLWDKPGTLRLSMQHRGMLIERHEVKLPPGSGVLAVPVPPGAEQWQGVAAAQQDGLVRAPSEAADVDGPHA